MRDMTLGSNPVLDKNLFSNDGSLVTSSGELYKPGSYLWNKYNGEYHTHYNGEMCAGPHDHTNMLNEDRLLYNNLNSNEIDSKYLSNDNFKNKLAIEQLLETLDKSNLSSNAKVDLMDMVSKLENFEPINYSLIDNIIPKYSKKKKDYGTRINRNQGCTNPFAKNYDIYASSDDGSCEYLWNIFPQTFKMMYRYSDDTPEQWSFSYITLHGNGRFSIGSTPKFCDGTYEISNFNLLHTGEHTFLMEFWENEESGGRTTLEATWNGDVYQGFEGTRIRHDGVEGTFIVKPGWFHAPLFGSPGLSTTKSINNFFYHLMESGDASASSKIRLQTEDNYEKPKYNKRWWNLVGGVSGTGVSGGEYEIDVFNKTFKIIYNRASDLSCSENSQILGCRSVVTGDLDVRVGTEFPSGGKSFILPKDIGLSNGGYYNEEGGYNIPNWASGFILASEENATRYCIDSGYSNGQVWKTRYVSNMFGNQYESSWTYENNEWLEMNYSSPIECPSNNCSGDYALLAVCCNCAADYTTEELSEIWERDRHQLSVTNAQHKKFDGEMINVQTGLYSLYYDNTSSGNGSVNKESGIQTTSLSNLNQQDCENPYDLLEEVDYSNCSCISPDVFCPEGYVYDFNLEFCVYDCPPGTEWNGMFNPPSCEGIAIGDLNGDGIVNVVDVVALVNHIMGTTQLTGDALLRADLNGDGIVNVVDIVQLVNMILGISDISELERQQLIFMRENLNKNKTNLDSVMRKTIHAFDKNIIGEWICPKSVNTITADCTQMNTFDQILWNEYKSKS